jgi:hypothetical protein
MPRIAINRAVQPSVRAAIEGALVGAFKTTNRRFLELAEREGWIDGTTAVVVVGIGESPPLSSKKHVSVP